MLSPQDTKQKISHKRLFDDNGKTVVNSNAGELRPKSSPVKKIPKLSAATPSLLCTEETLDAFDDFPAEAVISLAKPKAPSPKKQKSLPMHGVFCLNNVEQIILWITKNNRFLVSSFSGKLDEWVNDKLNTEPSFIPFKIILKNFSEEFHSAMQSNSSIDVRKVEPGTRRECEDLFPDVYACFIDAINGLTDDLGRNTEVLHNRNNSLLREFLVRNRLVAECLAYGLPILNNVVELWAKEHPMLDLGILATPAVPQSPKKVAVKSPAKSPGKSSVKSVTKKNYHEQENLDPNNKNKSVNLLANSMNSFLMHINSSEVLRQPIDNTTLVVSKPAVQSNSELPAILRRSRKTSV